LLRIKGWELAVTPDFMQLKVRLLPILMTIASQIKLGLNIWLSPMIAVWLWQLGVKYLRSQDKPQPSAIWKLSAMAIQHPLAYRVVVHLANPLHTALQNGQALQEIFTLNASYRTACLREIGGFDISLRAAEDSDVSARMYEKFPHYTIVYGQKAQVGHRHRRVLWPWVAQNYVRSQDAFIQIRKEHRIPPIFPLPVLTLIIAAGASFFGPVAGLTALIVSPVLLYWWWQVRVIRKPQIDRILFPYMQLAIESAVLSGYIRAFLKTL
jgi:hypothetical protein